VIHDEDLVVEARRKGALLRERLDGLAADSQRVGDVRGLGLLQGLELVVDRETLAPPAGAAARLVAACRERGLMIYSCPTPLGATTIEAVMLAPPLTIADSELDEVVTILGDALAVTA
jgi:4-aminobutyrate aminotransferase-like enzyme